MMFTLQATGMAITLGACNLKEILISLAIVAKPGDLIYDELSYSWLCLLSIGGMYILVITKTPKDVFKDFSII